jgi:hypothetical protein
MSQNNINMRPIAERVVEDLLEGFTFVLEDRLDDIIAKSAERIPGSTPQAKRQTLEGWMSFDPSRNKKYFPWMVKQFLANKVVWSPQNLDNVRDVLMDFEHYITMPAFDAPRDIYQYDVNTLSAAVAKHRGLTSKADRLRGRKTTAANVISQVGDMELVGFKDGKSIAEESWRVYDERNPNWDGDPHYPTDPVYNQGPEPYSVDHLWCTRNPERGANYAKGSPSKTFYIVRKGGWPYCAAVLSDSGSQIMDVHNHQISVGVAEEIYPLFRPVLDEYAKNRWSIGQVATQLFGLIRIVRGEIQPGETIQGADLSKSSLKSLPDDLTVSGNLNVSNTPLTRLPNNLKVQGDLSISGTKIKELPTNLVVSGNLNLSGTLITALPQTMTVGTLDISNTKIQQLPPKLEVKLKLKINGTPIKHLPDAMVLDKGASVEYSDPLSMQEIKRWFFWYRAPDLRVTYFKNPKNASYTSPEQQEAAWQSFIPKLQQHFQTDKTVDKAVASLFKKVSPRS